MENIKFEKEVREILPLVKSHASDYFGLSGCKNFQDGLKKIGSNGAEFLSKCYDGFKLAQLKIVENILALEEEMIVANNAVKAAAKGVHKADLLENKDYFSASQRLNHLEYQKSVFQELANVMVWTILLMERAHIKHFLRDGGGSGFLKDRDLESAQAIADDYNQDRNCFALIADITSVLHIGDLLVVKNGTLTLVEVKTKSPVNDKISELVHGLLETDRLDPDGLAELKAMSPKHGRGQLQRYFRQVARGLSALQYLKEDETFDPDLGLKKMAYEILTQPISMAPLVAAGIETAQQKDDKSLITFPTDCCFVGISRNSDYGFKIAAKLDFRHHVYHRVVKPWDGCQYGKIAKGEEITEINDYMTITVYSLVENAVIPAFRPIFLLLPDDQVLDLVFKKVAVYIFFDHEHFLRMCDEKRLPARLVGFDETRRRFKTDGQEPPPLFVGQCIVFGKNRHEMLMGQGILCSIVYDLESGYTVILRIKEMLRYARHPHLYWFAKKFVSVRSKVRRFGLRRLNRVF